MTAQPISMSGDLFTMGNQQFDLETLMMALQMQRTDNIDQQLVDQSNQLKAKNKILAEAQHVLGLMRQARNGNRNRPAAYDAFVAKYHVTTTGGSTPSEKEWDANIENMKGFIDAQNSTSQLDMIRLQSLMNKRNQAFDMMTNTISKLAKNRDSIIGNIR